MYENQVLVLLMRRDENELPPEEIAVIQASFPGREVVFERTDSRDYLEHAKLCDQRKQLGYAQVIGYLPKERPVPSLAMERGVPHVLVINGKLQELLPLKPDFKPFELQ